MSGLEIVFHVGYPKCATTFLQMAVFPRVAELNHHSNNTTVDPEWRHFMYGIIDPDLDFDPAEFRKRFMRLLDKNKVNLISNEGLIGDVFSADPNRPPMVIDRIKAAFPEARIILGRRDPTRLIISLYQQYVRQGGTLHFVPFLQEVIDISLFTTTRYEDYLKSTFGADRVYIYHMEDLREDDKTFIANLCAFLGVPPPTYTEHPINIASGRLQVRIARTLNHLFRTPLNPHGWFPWFPYHVGIPFPPRFLLENRLSYAIHYDRNIISEQEGRVLAEMIAATQTTPTSTG